MGMASLTLRNLLAQKRNTIPTDKMIAHHINYELMPFHEIRNYEKLYGYIHEMSGKEEGRVYLFIDEIQNCEGWELATASLLAEERFDIFISGSNASMLSGDLATHIAGRYIEIQVYPLNFKEYFFFAEQLQWPNKSKIERLNDYIRYSELGYRDQDIAHVLENLVFTELLTRGYQIYQTLKQKAPTS